MLHRLGWFLIWVGLLSTILAWVLAAPPMCVRYGIGIVIFSSFVTYWTRWQPVSELHRLRALCEKQLRMLEAAAVAAGVHKPAFTPTAGFDMTGGITLKPTPEQAAALMNTVSSNGRIEPHVQHVRHTPQPEQSGAFMPHMPTIDALTASMRGQQEIMDTINANAETKA